MNRVFLIGLILILNQPGLASDALQEIQFAKAELALIDGDEKEAIRNLRENLKVGSLHLPTYLMLTNIYLQKGENHRAFKVLYFLIRRLHPVDGARLLSLGYIDNVSAYLQEMSPPTREALEIYFLIAQNYYFLAERGNYTPEFRSQLYNLAAKYFIICDYYKYSLPQTNYFLGIVHSRRQLHQEAITRLLEAKDLFEKEEEVESTTEIQNINFMIGDNLIREGYRDAGTLYLNSLYLDLEADESLRQYSKSYLDQLSSNFQIFSVGLNYNYRQNIYRFDDSFLEDYDTFKSILGPENGATIGKSLSYFVSTKRYGHLIYSGSVSLREDLAHEDLHWRLDSRIAGGGLEVKYDNLKRSLLKFSLNYNHILTKLDQESDFKSSTTNLVFNLEYVHTLKRGTLSYRLPFSLRERKNDETLSTRGFSLSYVPFYRTRWMSPSFSTEFSLLQEGEDLRDTKELQLSLSNHFRHSNQVSTFLFASYTKTDHELDRLSKNEYSLNLYTSFLLRFVRNLSANVSVSHSLANTGDDDSIRATSLTTGINYSF
jgi:hypothetical protein